MLGKPFEILPQLSVELVYAIQAVMTTAFGRGFLQPGFDINQVEFVFFIKGFLDVVCFLLQSIDLFIYVS